MSLSRILDESIIEPPPPFRDLDGLIARERRRTHSRRIAAVVAGVAGVLVAALGFPLLVGTGGGTGSGPAPGASTATPSLAPTVPADETAAARLDRLSALLRQRIAAALPAATVSPAAGSAFQASAGDTRPGYDQVEAALRVDGADLQVVVIRPLAPPYPQPTLCIPSTVDSCEERPGPDGTRVAVTRRAGTQALLVTVWFPGGGMVTALLGGSPVTAEQLTAIVADGGYVAGAAAPPYRSADVGSNVGQQPRQLPGQPELGVAYPVDLYAHCGIDLMSFAGHVWRSVQPDDGSYPGWLTGTLELLDQATARVVIDQHVTPSPHEVIVYRWTDEELPRCA